ncbi:hypothetical protein BDU57DRAFT_563853, partial [Ampelomyces quisqualis]
KEAGVWQAYSKALFTTLCNTLLNCLRSYLSDWIYSRSELRTRIVNWRISFIFFSEFPIAFVVVETEGLRKVYQHDADWNNRLLKLLQRVVDQTTMRSCLLCIGSL